jgi:outer membrane receptor protein involved in Fe transport
MGAAAPIALCVALAAQPALAQDGTSKADDSGKSASSSTTSTQDASTSATAPVPNAASNSEDTSNLIVVTGTRIPHSNFNTPSPLDIVTRDDRVLAGVRSTADVLDNATVTSGSSQINGAFLGFVSEGGPAADTIGLRGLGSQRTLVLLNGRRLAPSGVGPQLVSADLNVLPTAVVKQMQILREGASSVYGSDAIAGVINIITDDKLDGITVDGYANLPTGYDAGRNSRIHCRGQSLQPRPHPRLVRISAGERPAGRRPQGNELSARAVV